MSAGSYLLDIHSHSHAFAPLRVDVSGTGAGDGNGVGEKVQVWGTFRGNEWGNKGEEYAVRKVGGVWVWEVRVIAEKEYFFERSGCEYLLPIYLSSGPQDWLFKTVRALLTGPNSLTSKPAQEPDDSHRGR